MTSTEELNCSREEQHLLRDDFTLFPGKCAAVRVTLYNDRVVVEKRRASDGQNGRVTPKADTVRLADVIGCECGRARSTYASNNSRLSLTSLTTKKPPNDTAAAFLCLHSYPYNKPAASGGFRRKRDVIFRVNKYDTHEQNLEIAQKWRLAILLILRRVTVENEEDISAARLPPARKLLVLVNPASGRRKGVQIFNKQVVPIFRDAELDYDLVVTNKQFQATEMAKTLDPNEWQGIVVVAGDGLVYEVLNGMMMHQDPSSVLKIPIGIIPAGSGNALFAAVMSKTGEQLAKLPPLHAAFLLCKGGHHPIDLVSITTPIRHIHSFLALTWGIIADIDIESERFRWMGKPRFTIGTIIRVLNLRRYHGALSYLPAENQEQYEHLRIPAAKKKVKKRLPRPHSTMDTTSEGLGIPKAHLPRFRSLNADLSKIEAGNGLAFSEEFIMEDDDVGSDDPEATESNPLQANGFIPGPNHPGSSNPSLEPSSQSSYLPPKVTDPLPEGWTTIEGDFVGILLTYMSHIAVDVEVWPRRKFDEGVISIQFMHFPQSRRNMVEFVNAIQTGRHLTLPFTRSLFVKAFRLVPLTKPGILTVDGEVIEYGPVQGEVLSNKPHIIIPTDQFQST
ncbi:sphingosine kinase 1-like [Patiria miniata]|uniref:DAGKc domain-containing protein n=1 Tax=Patiria miniata TaxID=46514 RepID=A0A914ANQ9_PATMI|nr:sphingosine kinase 1-like [Patiria miniata]